MSNEESNKRRITVKIEDEELHRKIQQLIPWGSLKPLINKVMADVIDLMEEHNPRLILGAILSDDIQLKDYLDRIEKMEKPYGKHSQSEEEHN